MKRLCALLDAGQLQGRPTNQFGQLDDRLLALTVDLVSRESVGYPTNFSAM